MSSEGESAGARPSQTVCKAAVWSFRLSPVLPVLLSIVALVSFVGGVSGGEIWDVVIATLIPLVVVFVLTGPAGLVFGVVALVKIGRSRGRLTGTRYAVIGTALTCVTSILLYVALLSAERSLANITCVSNLRDLRNVMGLYEMENNDRFPPPEKWNETLKVYEGSASLYRCPSAHSKKPSYAMNAALKGKRTTDIKDPAHTVVLFESVPGENLVGGPELLPAKPRHGRYHVLFADEYIRSYTPEGVRKLTKWR